MDFGVVGTRLASSVVSPLVKRLFVQEGRGADLVRTPVRISGLVSFRGEKRVVGEREVHRIAGELVRRAVSRGERPIGADQDLAVTDALCRTLLGLGELTMEDAQAVDLGHRAFALRLREAVPDAARDLSQDATHLYEALLETACLHILHFFTQRSSFVPRQQVEQSRRLRDVVDRLDQLADRMPSSTVADAQFERRYAEFVDRKYNSLTIYGLDLRQSREWPLDSAYLSLRVEASAELRHELPDARQYQQDGRGDGLTLPHAVGGARQAADRALAGHERVMLRGLAGSGKTTLVQWLAVTTARQDADAGVPHLLGRVPFVLPLRTLTRGGAGLPLPSQFLAATGCPLAGSQPEGWVERVLSAGRGVLLIDGVDEQPAEERERTRRWLRDQLTAFPQNQWVVTTRATAVRDGWLAEDRFSELSLSPMSRAEVTAFVGRWHTAADADDDLAPALLETLRTKPDLAGLASNPLMCGLICALHRERRGYLPRGRKALYDAALSTLLYRRDVEREVMPGSSLELDDEAQTSLLQKLAYWLIRNGRSELDKSGAVRLIARALPTMPYVAQQADAQEVFDHLLLRSGLLREPSPGAVDFVHRTFQDYLGARAAVEEGDLGVLAQHAHLDQWADVLRMAVAHARPDERAALLRQLIERGDSEPIHRTRLHLLATACLEHAPKLDPQVRAEVEARTGALVPPRSYAEAKELAAAGPVILDLLPGPERLQDDESSAVVHTACQRGGDAPLPLLLRFLERPSNVVAYQLAGHWDRFDTATYAHEILRPLLERVPATLVTVRSAPELEQILRLPVTHLRLSGDFTSDQLAEAVAGNRLAEFELVNNNLIENLDELRGCTSLTRLRVSGCLSLRDLSDIGDLPLRSLHLNLLPKLRDFGPLQDMDRLSRLVFGSMSQCDDAAAVLPFGLPLTELGLSSWTVRLRGIERCPQLTRLHVAQRERPLQLADWNALHALPELRTLHLESVALPTAETDPVPLAGVTYPCVRGGGPTEWVRRLVQLFPAMQALQIHDATELDVTALAAAPELRTLFLSRVENLTGLEGLPPAVEVVRRPRPRV
ncbi:NACHT domain-containing protein [Streptomyces sp. XM4193]|uniref:NACHT domain-containing protein n=1 Tax=Streptomyces sp. XM4193 TaxID=2929782 RepID=UPI001FFB8CE7|nr:NACHT domain-containing protein [Streptomyces sp. XM4193]MCK1795456.1 NACHT domain-containing protein [Streptomyces sp. XM4193]